MGRHGAGQSSHRAARVSLPLVAIAVLVLAAIGFGIWLWSVRSVTDPIDAKPVDAYAVVVSSPACTSGSGSGSTVIDLSLTPVVRSSLSACGRRVDERLAVQYLDGHPDQVRLPGTTVARGSALGRWLPIAILAAGLLAVVATIALLIDRRQSRHAGAATRVTVAQLRAGALDDVPAPAAHAAPVATGTAVRVVPAVAEVLPVAAGDGRVAAVDSARADHGTAGSPADGAQVPDVQGPGTPPSASPEDADKGNPDVTTRIAMGGFLRTNSQLFRHSEIAVEDDLLTHRGPEAPDR